MPKQAILCVDDEQIILSSLLIQLRNHFGSKYLYETALTGQEALEVIDELVEQSIFTILVISDWLMPGMKGDEFLIAVHERYPDTVKIMLTGHADKAAIQNAEESAELYSCISKPWDADKLLGIVEDALKGDGE